MLKKNSQIFGLAYFILALCACTSKVVSRASKAEQLTVMTYNIHHANPPSKPGYIDLDAIAAVIKKENPDLVGLQEVDRFTNRSGNIDQAKVIAAKTGMYYQFFMAIDYDGGNYGLAILSKTPIEGKALKLPQVMAGEARIVCYAQLLLKGGKSVIFANTHLDAQRPDSNRVVQMKAMLKEWKDRKLPIVLVGDLNSESSAVPIKLLDNEYIRSCITNCALTIPQDVPKKTIDYIAVKNASWHVLMHRVIAETYASDHRPVVATYKLN